MPHPFPERLILATHNHGKLAEFAMFLGDYGNRLVAAGDLGLPEPDETGTDFAANARLKALAAAGTANLPALADDSGLCVNGLDGEPGLFSARWAEPNKDFVAAMRRVHESLGNNPDRSAYFTVTLAYALPDGTVEFFEGRVEGTIVWPPRGTNGHGYDPIFVPVGETRTFAEMTDEEKNAISHRGRAVRKFLNWMKGE